MKLLEAAVRGFGKLYQSTYPFQDGLTVIYGANEAGKSTLHTFLGCMLFGLDKGRGRAARTGLYAKYLPWDHDAAFGGALTFESDEMLCRVERSFRVDTRSCTLMTPAGGRRDCPSYSLPPEYLEGLTENLYYNTISIRQMKSGPDATLAEELRRQLARFRSGGNDEIDASAALSRLRSQKKELETCLDPGLEKRLAEARLASGRQEEALRDVSFRQEKADLEGWLDETAQELEENAAERGRKNGRNRAGSSENDSHGAPARHGRSFRHLFIVLCFLALALTGLLALQNSYPAAAGSGILSLLSLLLALITGRRRSTEEGAQEQAEQNEEEEDDPAHDEETAKIRLRLKQLQQRYNQVCRKEWEWEQDLMKWQDLQEEIASLEETVKAEEEIRLEIQAVTLAMTTLQSAAAQTANVLGPALNASMSRILSGITGGVIAKVYTDDALNLSVEDSGRTVPLESLSRGSIEQVWFALRLAVIDLIFPEGGMPLLLDDCFVAYDDDRLTATLTWLAENYPGQILLFTCQNREQEILSREQISYSLISL